MFVGRDVGKHERTNPFRDELALTNSAYAGFRGKRLVYLPSGEPTAPLMEFVHDSFRALVLGSRFSCVGAKAAIRGGADRKSTRLNSSHANISYAVFCLKKQHNPHPSHVIT